MNSTNDRRYLLYLLIWPVQLLRYVLLENLNPAAAYTPVSCALDDLIPFQEGFLIFYVFWYVFIVGMHFYTLLYDIDAFKKYSRFLILSMSISTACFLLFPTCQNLRPEAFPRDNFLTGLVRVLYALDTNTNVCPSEHVIGAIAVMVTAWHCRGLKKPLWQMSIALLTLLICASTVFLKQHSVVDFLAALPICLLSYAVCFHSKKRKNYPT